MVLASQLPKLTSVEVGNSYLPQRMLIDCRYSFVVLKCEHDYDQHYQGGGANDHRFKKIRRTCFSWNLLQISKNLSKHQELKSEHNNYDLCIQCARRENSCTDIGRCHNCQSSDLNRLFDNRY